MPRPRASSLGVYFGKATRFRRSRRRSAEINREAGWGGAGRPYRPCFRQGIPLLAPAITTIAGTGKARGLGRCVRLHVQPMAHHAVQHREERHARQRPDPTGVCRQQAKVPACRVEYHRRPDFAKIRENRILSDRTSRDDRCPMMREAKRADKARIFGIYALLPQAHRLVAGEVKKRSEAMYLGL